MDALHFRFYAALRLMRQVQLEPQRSSRTCPLTLNGVSISTKRMSHIPFDLGLAGNGWASNGHDPLCILLA